MDEVLTNSRVRAVRLVVQVFFRGVISECFTCGQHNSCLSLLCGRGGTRFLRLQGRHSASKHNPPVSCAGLLGFPLDTLSLS
jgi:hypothetical protein